MKEQRLYDLGTAYYMLGDKVSSMKAREDRPGNRTAEYQSALRVLEHAKEHVWLNIRSEVIIGGIQTPDKILDAAWEAVRHTPKLVRMP